MSRVISSAGICFDSGSFLRFFDNREDYFLNTRKEVLRQPLTKKDNLSLVTGNVSGPTTEQTSGKLGVYC